MTTGVERWVRRLRPYVHDGYVTGCVRDGRLILTQDCTGRTVSFPMPSSSVGRWLAGSEIGDLLDRGDASDTDAEQRRWNRWLSSRPGEYGEVVEDPERGLKQVGDWPTSAR